MSKFDAGAVHLSHKFALAVYVEQKLYSLRTPSLHNTRQECLLWVIREIWTQRDNDPPVVAISAKHYDWFLHSSFESLQDMPHGLMEDLLLKITEVLRVFILFLT